MNPKHFFSLIVLMLAYSLSSFSQFKPKRVVTESQSVETPKPQVVKEQPSTATAKPAVKKKSATRKSNGNSTSQRTAQGQSTYRNPGTTGRGFDLSRNYGVTRRTSSTTSSSYTVRQTTSSGVASFLTVNSQRLLEDGIPSDGATKNYAIRTDGAGLVIDNLPVWAHCTAASVNEITIVYDANEDYEERKQTISVTSGSYSAYIDVVQAAKTAGANVDFNYIYIFHNTTNNMSYKGQSCLQVKADVTLSGAEGHDCYVMAYFTDEYGNKISANGDNPQNGSTGRSTLYSECHFVPTTDNPKRYTVSLTIPNNSILLNRKKGVVNCHVSFRSAQSPELTDLETVGFMVKKKKSGIVTKAL